ncbi:MAG: ABC-2 family transporter protein [Chloroflexi bacterium]|uniref:ABC-2 family transporter protein n=1 Tax=Candidatus Chlorohelix allophototropha TaxID=3003348 RepID=A0A8T7M3Z3_9CHLR|nr:ABC-2 family transporter protein [Chloroflexota bacterium]WJW70208.1 ABC-2 family transporter protein [Chloroflexota bacterium L227-S17]
MLVNKKIEPLTPGRWRFVFRRYWTLCKVAFQERMEYRWNVLFYSMLALLPVMVGIYLWTTIFNSRNDPQAVKYITTYYLVAGFLGWRIAQYQWTIMFEIREGRMATGLLRPMSYPAKTFWFEVGGRTWSTIITIPVFVLAAVFLGENFKLPENGWTWALVLLSFMLAYVLNFFITASLGLLTVWQNQPEGFFALYGFGSGALGGTMVPLALMPGGIGDILQWLPFAYIYSLPARIFLGISAEQLVQGLAVQVVWLVIAALFFKWMWRKAIQGFEVYEG